MPTYRARIGIAIVAGMAAAIVLWFRFRGEGPAALAIDFTPYWRAGIAVRQGISPYVAINATSKAYPCCNSGFLYMFPAAIFFLPFSYLPPQAAAILTEGIGVAVFAFAILRDGYWRLPILLSYPLFFAAASGQVVPLLTAAFLLPSLGFLASIKFTNGAVGFLYSLSWRYAVLAAIPVILSMLIWPWWPMQFWAERHDVAGVYYHVPILLPFGALLLAVLYRWRRKEARLVAGMSCIPQTMLYYDQLPLMLIAKNYRECLWAAVLSWVVPMVGILVYGNGTVDRELLFARTAILILVGYYLPAALWVLLRRDDRGLPTVRQT